MGVTKIKTKKQITIKEETYSSLFLVFSFT